jgi:hypothetical protein
MDQFIIELFRLPGATFVVMDDDLDRSAEDAAFFVYMLLPKPEPLELHVCERCIFARQPEGPSDIYWLSSLREVGELKNKYQNQCNKKKTVFYGR